MNKLIRIIGAAVAAAFVTMPALAGTVSHWDFSSDSAGEIDITGHNDLVNNGGVTIQDGAAVFDGTPREFITGHDVDLRNDQPYTFECFVLAEPDCDGMIMEVSPNSNDIVGGFYLGQLDDIKITGRALAPAEFMTKRSKPPRGMIISIQ